MGTQVLVPPLGQTVNTVTLVAWLKDEGDGITQGEPLFTIETDKATLDVEAPASGVLRQVTARAGDKVRVLDAIATIAGLGEDPETIPARPKPAPTTRSADTAPAPGPEAIRKQQPVRGQRIFISPRARRLAETHRIPLSALQPTGPEGAIVERDVRAYLDTATQPDLAPASQIGYAKLNVEADVTSLAAVRRRLAQDGLEVSYADLFVYVLGRTLRNHPRLNATLHGAGVKLQESIHVGLAVDADRDLVFPVVRDVDRKGLRQLAAETRLLVERARAGLCTSAELSGETFRLANVGVFGIDSFTPLIQPECAMLSLGRIKTQPAFEGDRVVAHQMVWLSLTINRRLVGTASAARFLQQVVQLVEQPHLLLT
jgi:pyruvate dehydrogenase E2 component (dihydrolipoamide acetyltransferase)